MLAVIALAACNSNKKTKDGFTVLENGLEIKMLEDKDGPKADSGSMAKINIEVKVNDSVVFNSKQANNNQPIPQGIAPSKTISDWMAGYMELSEGDRAVFRSVVDSIFPDTTRRPPGLENGDVITFEVEMVELKRGADLAEEKEKRMAAQSKDIEKYLKDNNLKGTKTASGMYIVVKKEGSGPKANNGQIAKMNYTGYLMDGTVFDSNEDPKFGHVTPFKFPLGQGQVIRGWDEGIAALNKGAKAKLIIPSDLAYGETARPGNDKNPKGIPANSTLIFDVEVLDFEDMQAPPTGISADGRVQ